VNADSSYLPPTEAAPALEGPANDNTAASPASNNAQLPAAPFGERAHRRKPLTGAALPPIPPEIARRFVHALAELLVTDLTRPR
jgi:hypothetical protein